MNMLTSATALAAGARSLEFGRKAAGDDDKTLEGLQKQLGDTLGEVKEFTSGLDVKIVNLTAAVLSPTVQRSVYDSGNRPLLSWPKEQMSTSTGAAEIRNLIGKALPKRQAKRTCGLATDGDDVFDRWIVEQRPQERDADRSRRCHQRKTPSRSSSPFATSLATARLTSLAATATFSGSSASAEL